MRRYTRAAVMAATQRPVSELEEISEQDEPIALRHCGEESSPRLRTAQHVDPGAGTEMQVGDDQRADQVTFLA